MIKLINFVLAMVASLALVGVYGIKYSVEDTASQRSQLLQYISGQKADLSLLKADWAYLNQPARIEPIVRRHAETLGLEIASSGQFISMGDLPMRPVEPDNAALTDLFKAIDAGIDPIAALIEGTL